MPRVLQKLGFKLELSAALKSRARSREQHLQGKDSSEDNFKLAPKVSPERETQMRRLRSTFCEEKRVSESREIPFA